MRPPDLPGGNVRNRERVRAHHARFNEAAGFTRRKLVHHADQVFARLRASMRPPDLPGGNLSVGVDVSAIVEALQ